ncbi:MULTISPECIES: AraC family transcriptional regulator [Flavobacteriaceae]|jgi:AraC-like DNA-binding protein|uniref:AraC family transcriptional regulator n=2 Tax=Flavobacteriaceae TaxID=49546 RepID=A0A4Y8AWX7_9FLAO|nr:MULTISPECIES: AraC family transcriptional regulator [Flavobacteriaceae]TEW76508.1 AraC family transcriptional regulator [Gramella jeungdoensis]GGK53570.1 AraC family transcriptional regulator [Lutibacter litoralis]
MIKDFHREITPLAPEDSFQVFDRIKDDFDFPIHFHPEYELNFIANGQGVRRIIGDSIEEISELELVLVGPNIEHCWELHNCKNKKIHEITIQFHNDLFDSKMLSRRIFKPIKDMFDRSNYGIVFSKKITLEMKDRIKALSKIDSIDYLMELISILQDLANSRNQRMLSTYSSQNKNFENSDKIKIVYDFIQENFHRKILLSEVSEIVNMSSVSFNRFIKKRTGKTFVDYINGTRISYATRWLIETDLSISEICFKCGFNNIANFNRVFKKSKNSTPSEYREKFEGIKRVL